MKKIELSDHFTCKRLLIYSLPAIGEILAATSFELVDGLFIANYLGVDAFAAIDLVLPPFIIIFSAGYMFGTGASAVIAQNMGEGNRERGCEIFSLTVAVMTFLGIIAAMIGTWKFPLLAQLVGASAKVDADAVIYGRILMACLPAFLINAAFESLWIAAEKAWIGLWVAIINGLLNVVFDWMFMGPMHGGIKGAAIATALSAVITAVITLVYFLRSDSSDLKFVRVRLLKIRELAEVCFNGVSETVGDIAINVTTILANRQLLRYIGENGVAAMGVFNGMMELFMAVFMGVSSTVITIAGFQYGEKEESELNSLVKTNTVLIFGCGIIMCLFCVLCSKPIAWAYFSYDTGTYELTTRVLRISAVACLFYGFDIITTSFFTGLGDGLGSAIIAAFSSLINPVAMIYILPAIFGIEGLLWASPASAFLTAVLAALFIKFRYPVLRKKMYDDRDESHSPSEMC